jgi:nucleoside-diphosphate-sugar epimerase/predicted dehydrogenase
MKNQRSIKTCIVGAGYISEYHLRAARTAGAEVTGVCDLSAGRAERFADANGLTAYVDLAQMIQRERPQAVHVLAPPQAHFAVGKQLIEAGVHVLLEKPMCTEVRECQELKALAEQKRVTLGVSHNFLFHSAFESLYQDVRRGRFGRIDQIDIVWNKFLPQLRFGPFAGFMFERPDNILLEIGPHSFAHLLALTGDPDELNVFARDKVELPRGRHFYRQWEALGVRGGQSSRLRFSFVDGYTEHYVKIRGTAASATCDIEHCTYVVQEHTPQMLDVDRYAVVADAARQSFVQATDTLGRFVLGKMGLIKDGGPFQRSITRATEAFYDGFSGTLDERLGAELGVRTIAFGRRMMEAAKIAIPEKKAAKKPPAPKTKPKVLVLGGTGFIGRVLVKQLVEAGHGVRLIARDPSALPEDLLSLDLDVVRGDYADTNGIAKALDGIEHVYHLARGFGQTWPDYLATDVEPAQRLAEVCAEHGVKGFYYASSIAIYYAGADADPITEQTEPRADMLRSNLYARCKVEIEKKLEEVRKERGLPVVIFRPGIVLGRGSSPLHWGIAGWPFNSVPRLWGDGNNALPTVLVEDVANAMVKALGRKDLIGKSFNLVGEPHVTANQYLDELERHSGLKFRRIPTSSKRYFAEEIGKFAIKTVGRDPHRRVPALSDWEGRTFGARFDATRARSELGWTPVESREVFITKAIVEPCQEFLQ